MEENLQEKLINKKENGWETIDEETKKKAMQGLKSAAGFIRRELGKRIDLRYTPEFVFELDDSIEHGANIERLLNNINKK